MIELYTDILSNLIITKIHSVSTMYTEKTTNTKRTNRPLWAIVVKYEGETLYESSGKKYISNINNINILPKGSSYNWICTESGHFSIVEFECEASHSEIFSFNVKNGETYLKVLKKIELERALKKPTYRINELRDLYGLISSLLKTTEQKYLPTSKYLKILPAIEYIAKNYNKNICNDELASVTELSTVYFRKLFKEVMGISPIKYIQSVKTKKAKEMLSSDYSSITDIAYSLGYDNVYEFSRSFKKYVGISPTQYEKQLYLK